MAVSLARLWRPTGDAVFWKRSLRPFETEIQMDKSKGTNRSNSEFLKMFSIVSVEIYISFKLHATLEDLVFARPPKKWQFIAVITQVISPTLALHPPPARSFGVRSCCLGIFWEHRFEIRRVSQGYRKRARRKKWLKNHLQVVGGWLK